MWLERMSKATAMVRRGNRPFDIARELRIWPAQQIDAILNTAAKMGDAGIRRAVDLLAETDRRTKNGIGDASTNVEQFILSLAGK
jgi:DNA polymerase III delta subunit